MSAHSTHKCLHSLWKDTFKLWLSLGSWLQFVVFQLVLLSKSCSALVAVTISRNAFLFIIFYNKEMSFSIEYNGELNGHWKEHSSGVGKKGTIEVRRWKVLCGIQRRRERKRWNPKDSSTSLHCLMTYLQFFPSLKYTTHECRYIAWDCLFFTLVLLGDVYSSSCALESVHDFALEQIAYTYE